MGRRILGLDICTRTVRAVLLDSTYRAWTVVGHAAQPVVEPAPAVEAAEGATAADPTSLRDRQAAAVRELVAEHGFAFEDAIVSLPGAAASAGLRRLGGKGVASPAPDRDAARGVRRGPVRRFIPSA